MIKQSSLSLVLVSWSQVATYKKANDGSNKKVDELESRLVFIVWLLPVVLPLLLAVKLLILKLINLILQSLFFCKNLFKLPLHLFCLIENILLIDILTLRDWYLRLIYFITNKKFNLIEFFTQELFHTDFTIIESAYLFKFPAAIYIFIMRILTNYYA